MSNQTPFTFSISLTVLDHLGRNLYRNFVTVLGEAISNAWDADAGRVDIYIDREAKTLTIVDNGDGMSAADFAEKFLKIGFSKRKESRLSRKKRPYIGRKGIGKLALLSCADKVTVATRTSKESPWVGGTIDNKQLDQAITDDLTPSEYVLQPLQSRLSESYGKDLAHGTIIQLEGFKGGIRHSNTFLRTVLALFFRFALLDKQFSIRLDGDPITLSDLAAFASKSQFLWTINGFLDPYVSYLTTLSNVRENENLTTQWKYEGFLASVEKPSDLKIRESDERITIDLFVNGRLRERDILKHIPTQRLPESYLYGQIHVNGLDDDEVDRFTSSREGIVADDPEFQSFLNDFRIIFSKVIDRWDEWRRKHRKSGDSDNTKITPTQRKSEELVSVVSEEFQTSPDGQTDLVDVWLGSLADDAAFNVGAYSHCFLSENLIRNYIEHKQLQVPEKKQERIQKWRKTAQKNLEEANISFPVRQRDTDLSYLDMDDLSYLVEKTDPIMQAGLPRSATVFKPLRDACAHTALLTEDAKLTLNITLANIKGRLRKLLSSLTP